MNKAETAFCESIAREKAALKKVVEDLRTCLGFVENSSDQKVTISQDDATKDFFVVVGPDRMKTHTYFDSSLAGALAKAAEGEKQT